MTRPINAGDKTPHPVSNLATLQTAPPFTTANAREMGRRGALATAETKRRLKAEREARIIADLNNTAKSKIELEIGRILRAMAKIPVHDDDYLKLSGILDKLWSKAFPTQAAVKPNRARERTQVTEPLTETPQNPPN